MNLLALSVILTVPWPLSVLICCCFAISPILARKFKSNGYRFSLPVFFGMFAILAVAAYFFADFTRQVHNADELFHAWDNGIFSGEKLRDESTIPEIEYESMLSVILMLIRRVRHWILLGIVVAVAIVFAPKLLIRRDISELGHTEG